MTDKQTRTVLGVTLTEDYKPTYFVGELCGWHVTLSEPCDAHASFLLSLDGCSRSNRGSISLLGAGSTLDEAISDLRSQLADVERSILEWPAVKLAILAAHGESAEVPVRECREAAR